MRYLPAVLTALVVVIQYPLWMGKGGWVKVWEMDHQIDRQHQENASLNLRNTVLEGEVADLRRGLLAIEERARYELGMVRPDELYVQINPSGDSASPSANRGASKVADAQRYNFRTADAAAMGARGELYGPRYGAGRRIER